MRRVTWQILILGIIVFIGGALRFAGITYGLPFTYRPDEPTLFGIALRMIKTGDLNPHWFGYPPVIFYLNAIVLAIFSAITRTLGMSSGVADLPYPEILTIGVGHTVMPALFLLSRGLTALFGSMCIPVTYLIGRKIHSHSFVALFAAALLAVSPAAVSASQSIMPDSFALFFLLISLWGAIRILGDPRLQNYVLAGCSVSLAVASKYNAGVIILPLFAAHFLRFGTAGARRKELYIALGASAIAFLLVTPFAILDYQSFFNGFILGPMQYAVEGHLGQEGNAFSWYVNYLTSVEGWWTILALISILVLLYKRSRIGIVLMIFPGGYFLAISQLQIRNDRTVLLIIPILALLAAWLIENLSEWFHRFHLPRPLIAGAIGLASMYFLATPFQVALARDSRLNIADGREQARQWLESNLPAGTRVAVEGYAPYLDTRRFVVYGVETIPNHPLEWYMRNGFEYLVFTQEMYGRFFAEPDRLKESVAKYNAFFTRLQEVKLFDDNGFVVRVYKTGARLPVSRVAARFGGDVDLIELVGYELADTEWIQGEPLRIKLYWRTLSETKHPLEVALRLLSRDDLEIAAVRGDLFQGKGWQSGMFVSEWTLPIIADAAPGAYRLEVNVIQTQFVYRALITNWRGDKIENLELSPLKLSASPPPLSELQAAHSTNIEWSDQIELVGYYLDGKAHPGDPLTFSFYWESRSKPTRDYTFFAHLVDAQGNLRAQVDARPRNGMYPTLLWDAGESVRDQVTLALPHDLAPGTYQIRIGWYEQQNLARLPLVNAAGDFWTLPEAVVIQ